MKRLVLATGNKGKLRELQALLAAAGIEVLPQSEFGIEPPEETGTTFTENALLKARYASGIAKLPAIADDSGLEVDALEGRPGVYSARYAGPQASDADNNRKLLAELADAPDEKRTARYRCVLALVEAADDPAPLVCEGAWEGHIAREPAGDNGFGYDPLFIVAGMNTRAAQLAPEVKNSLSHRAQALRKLAAILTSKS